MMNKTLAEQFAKAFNNTNNTESKLNSHILIVDGLNYFIRIFSSVPALNDNGDHVGGVIGFLKSLAYTIRLIQPTRCILVFDGSGGSKFRRSIYSEYKGNRTNKTKLNRFDEFSDKESEEISMRAQMARLLQYLKILPLDIVSMDGIEADDAIAYLAQLAKERVTITSTDKDFFQLINDRVDVYRPTTKEIYTVSKIQEEYGIISENVLLMRLFTGDSSDNIPGIPGIGAKTLVKRFPELSTRKIELDDILIHCKAQVLENSKIGIYKTIVDYEEDLLRNFKLMQLHDVHIAESKKSTLHQIFNSAPEKMNQVEFIKMMSLDRMQGNMKDPLKWLHNSFDRLNYFAI